MCRKLCEAMLLWLLRLVRLLNWLATKKDPQGAIILFGAQQAAGDANAIENKTSGFGIGRFAMGTFEGGSAPQSVGSPTSPFLPRLAGWSLFLQHISTQDVLSSS